MKSYIYIVIALFFIFSFSCKKEKADDDITSPTSVTTPDTEGNLVIVNKTGSELYLYHQNKLIKELPTSSKDFLINIPIDGLATILKVWKKVSTPDPMLPSNNNLFRRWDVVLPSKEDMNSRAIWIIEEEGGETSGTIEFTYSELGVNNISNIYSIDVYLNNQDGSRVTALAPGTNGKKIGLEYGYQVLNYEYWFSDPNSTTGKETVTWLTEDEMGNNFSVILNANNQLKKVEPPIYYFSEVGRKGYISFLNNFEEDVHIFANGNPIEEIVISDVVTQGLSLVPKGTSATYVIPEGEYLFEVKLIGSNNPIELKSLKIIELYPYSWIIDGTDNHFNFTINNMTDKRITVHNANSESYLGYWINSGETSTFIIENTVSRIKVRNWLGNEKATTDNISQSIWTIDELN